MGGGGCSCMHARVRTGLIIIIITSDTLSAGFSSLSFFAVIALPMRKYIQIR